MERMPWHDALYFVTSTLTTVGYGDVVMKSSLGECVCGPLWFVRVGWLAPSGVLGRSCMLYTLGC